MKTTHAVLLVVLAVIAGGLLFVHLHNPSAFDHLLGGSSSPATPPASAPAKPTLPAKLAAPAVKAIQSANAKAEAALHPEDSAPAQAKPVVAAPADTKPSHVAAVPPPVVAPAPPAAIATPAPTFTPLPPARSSVVVSGSSIMNSPGDMINAPSTPVEAAPSQPADSNTPTISAAPADSAPASAAAWVPPSPTPAQPNWTWTTTTGQVYKKVKVVKMDPQSVTILHQEGGATIPLETLPPELQKLFNYDPATAEQWNVGRLVEGNLVAFRTGSIQSVNDAQLRGARYIAVYYSAGWSSICCNFTNRLVKFYKGFKPAHPEFEILFVSEDQNPAAMADYMRQYTMPWLAVSFDGLVHPPGKFKASGIESFAGAAIPDLVLLDATGRVLSDSYRDGKYIGPDAVLTDIESMVK